MFLQYLPVPLPGVAVAVADGAAGGVVGGEALVLLLWKNKDGHCPKKKVTLILDLLNFPISPSVLLSHVP